ncbi:MAG: GIY-YIG nuclease family protein [Promethearchaeota archaeon]
MAYWVYILECRDSRGRVTYYAGHTNDLARRFTEHSSGRGARYTRGRDCRVVHVETWATRAQAAKREAQIKAMSRRQKLALIRVGRGETR